MTATQTKKPKGSPRMRRLVRASRGAAFTEYLVIVAFFGIAVGAALASRTQMVLVDYANARDLLFLPSM
ncbi:MAG: hypothetical protein JWP97_163 [Labilithrix sp.]|nr:hypothetical protein [Labilithrix sp.]